MALLSAFSCAVDIIDYSLEELHIGVETSRSPRTSRSACNWLPISSVSSRTQTFVDECWRSVCTLGVWHATAD